VATGHSLGGALSEIGGMRLKAKFGVKTVVHNYGCPRVGNAAMAQYIGTRVDTLYRVVHNKDIVPHLPPEAF
jgi:predicted lipase